MLTHHNSLALHINTEHRYLNWVRKLVDQSWPSTVIVSMFPQNWLWQMLRLESSSLFLQMNSSACKPVYSIYARNLGIYFLWIVRMSSLERIMNNIQYIVAKSGSDLRCLADVEDPRSVVGSILMSRFGCWCSCAMDARPDAGWRLRCRLLAGCSSSACNYLLNSGLDCSITS